MRYRSHWMTSRVLVVEKLIPIHGRRISTTIRLKTRRVAKTTAHYSSSLCRSLKELSACSLGSKSTLGRAGGLRPPWGIPGEFWSFGTRRVLQTTGTTNTKIPPPRDFAPTVPNHPPAGVTPPAIIMKCRSMFYLRPGIPCRGLQGSADPTPFLGVAAARAQTINGHAQCQS